VTIDPPADGSFVVRGTYPRVRSKCVRPKQPVLAARYPGSLTAARAEDGTVTLTVKLPFQSYLDGIAEMPASWPDAALQAQAIAARTYALATTHWDGAQGEALTTPICATTSCQVYRGLPLTDDPSIEPWFRAVDRTAGQMLLYGGRPAETLYSATSNGRTYGNDEIFGSPPLPYLRPVAEHDDGQSPTSHWRVPVPLADLTRFLRAAGEWPDAGAISDATRRGGTVVVSGHGASRSMDVSTFRSALNVWARCLEPDHYPSVSWKGTPLAETVPSTWFTVRRGAGADAGGVVIAGRGAGHGVGMMQWGAYGKAIRGLTARQILAYYYGGLRPHRFPEPGTIRVQVATGLTSLTIEPSGPGATFDGHTLGGGPVRITGGAVLTVTGAI
jgi:stage II sporulation protein D